MMDSTGGTALLAEAVLQRRRHLRLRQGDVEQRGGVSVAVLRCVESARRAHPQRTTLTGLDRALEWPPGAAKALLDAGEPPFPGSTVTDIRAYAEELITGASWSVGGLAPDFAEAVRALPTPVVVATLVPLAVELARRFTNDPTVLTDVTSGAQDGGPGGGGKGTE